MEARVMELGTVLADSREYWGHEYWEGYRWSESEWEKIWQTILEVYKTGSPNRFLGQIIIKPRPSRRNWEFPEIILVDGLQRILTAAAILSVIWTKHTARYSDIHFNYLRFHRALFVKEDTLTAAKTVFEGLGLAIKAEHPLQKAFRYFDERITDDEEEYDLDKLAAAILYGLKVSVVTIDVEEDTERVYNMVNFRRPDES